MVKLVCGIGGLLCGFAACCSCDVRNFKVIDLTNKDRRCIVWRVMVSGRTTSWSSYLWLVALWLGQVSMCQTRWAWVSSLHFLICASIKLEFHSQAGLCLMSSICDDGHLPNTKTLNLLLQDPVGRLPWRLGQAPPPLLLHHPLEDLHTCPRILICPLTMPWRSSHTA